MEACWPPKSKKNRCYLQKRFFEKTLFFHRKNNDFEGSGGRSWNPKSIKNRSKNEVMMGRHLNIVFSWMLVDFEGQVGAMLGSKIDQNSIQEGIEKRMRKRRRLGGVLEASWGPKNPSDEPQPLELGESGARWRTRNPPS